MERQFQQFLDRHIARIKPIARELYLVHWQYDTTGDESLAPRKKQLAAEYLTTYADRDNYALLQNFEASGKIQDPLLKRQLTMLLNQFRLHQIEEQQIEKLVQVETDINSIFNHFRGKVDNQALNDNEIKQILQQETDCRLRRKAWLASKQIGAQVADKILELVRLRNENAQKAGYENYYLLSLDSAELQESKLFATLDELKSLTDQPFAEFKNKLDQQLAHHFGIAPHELRSWHYADPFFQEVPPQGRIELNHFFADVDIRELTRKTFQSIELGIDDIMQKSDLYPKAGKCQHAFCITIDPVERDIRVLCNIAPSCYWMSTMLHEFGHAIYDKEISRSLPYLLQEPAHLLSTEAIAMMMGSLARNSSWLVEIADISQQKIDKIYKDLNDEERLTDLIFIRWGLVMVHFERELYRNPHQDLNTLWWDYVEKFQQIKRPEGRNNPDWAAKIHFAIAPVYYQNYLYGQLVASQLAQHIQSHVGNGRLFNNPELGSYLVEHYFQSGAKLDWNSTLRQATGESLNPEYNVKTLGILN